MSYTRTNMKTFQHGIMLNKPLDKQLEDIDGRINNWSKSHGTSIKDIKIDFHKLSEYNMLIIHTVIFDEDIY